MPALTQDVSKLGILKRIGPRIRIHVQTTPSRSICLRHWTLFEANPTVCVPRPEVDNQRLAMVPRGEVEGGRVLVVDSCVSDRMPML